MARLIYTMRKASFAVLQRCSGFAVAVWMLSENIASASELNFEAGNANAVDAAAFISANAQSFDPRYDPDLELESRRLALTGLTQTKNPHPIGWNEVSKWTPTNSLQLRLWSAIDTIAKSNASLKWDDAVVATAELRLPKEIEQSILVSTICFRLTSALPLIDDYAAAQKLKALLQEIPDEAQRTALRARCIRKITAVPVAWSQDQEWKDQSKSAWAETGRVDILKWLIRDAGSELRGNIVVSCRIAKMIGEYTRCTAGIANIRAKAKASGNYGNLGPVAEDGTPMSEGMFGTGILILKPFIVDYASAGLKSADQNSRAQWAKDFCILMGRDDPVQFKELDERFFIQISSEQRVYTEFEQYVLKTIMQEGGHSQKLESSLENAHNNQNPTKRPDEWKFDPDGLSSEFKAKIASEKMEAGFVQHIAWDFGRAQTNRIGYLVFSPKNVSGKIPLVVFLPGNGEIGSDLSRIFRQRTILDVVRSDSFQKKHPCHLLVLSPPDGTTTLSGDMPDGGPTALQRALHSALLAVARTRKRPSVDDKRIYVTGLSLGGTGAYAMTFVYPNFFAASAPVAAHIFPPEAIGQRVPCAYFHLWNEGESENHPTDAKRLDALAARVRELGGDFRIGTFPASGHNAWDAAWHDEALWDWMFSKKLDANLKASSTVSKPISQVYKERPSVSGSKHGRDSATGFERAVDGLESTAYISFEPVDDNDWVQVTWDSLVTGKIEIRFGLANGTERLSKGRVEVSKDGKIWERAATVSQKTGTASFTQRDPIRYLRILPNPRNPETLVIREILLMP